ncbi:MAG: c-type cytochrome domain-containing protein [Planctomycetota bacterium]
MIWGLSKMFWKRGCSGGLVAAGLLLKAGLLMAVMGGGRLAAQGSAPAADVPSYNRDVRPILADKCFACHGFDAETREADLRLDTFEGATADSGGTRAIAPGKLTESELWNRINSTDESEVMPPPETHKQLRLMKSPRFAAGSNRARLIKSTGRSSPHWLTRSLHSPPAGGTRSMRSSPSGWKKKAGS